LNTKLKRFLMIPLLFICLSGLAVLWLWFGENGFVRLYRTETERRSCLERIHRLAEENQSLLDEVHRLRTDMKYVESVARKQLSLIKENEVIYRFNMEKPQSKGADSLP